MREEGLVDCKRIILWRHLESGQRGKAISPYLVFKNKTLTDQPAADNCKMISIEEGGEKKKKKGGSLREISKLNHNIP